MRVTEFLEHVFSLSISGYAKLVYFYLVGTTEGVTSQTFKSSREEISFYCGIGKGTVSKAIKELVAAGLIEEHRRGQGMPNSISIVDAENFMEWWWQHGGR